MPILGGDRASACVWTAAALLYAIAPAVLPDYRDPGVNAVVAFGVRPVLVPWRRCRHHHRWNAALTPPDDTIPKSSDTSKYGWSDEEFQSWFRSQLAMHSLMERYPRILDMAPKAVSKWRARFRGNPKLWKRIFTVDRVVKELVEAAPILDAVIGIVEETTTNSTVHNDEKFTILDLASGRGYLSMFLSEILPKDKVEKIILIDKAWPRFDAEPQPHHMSWEHLYGNRTTSLADKNEGTGESFLAGTYFETWPIHLHTSKQDLKQKCTRRTLKRVIFDRATGPVLILAVHLCGTLSLRAVEMFNDYPETVRFLALKPCCLPPMVYAKRGDVFEIGKNRFPASDVCAVGRFRGNKWYGPPRWHLEGRFNKWSEHLFAGVDLGESSRSLQGKSDGIDGNSASQKVFKDMTGHKAKIRELVQLDGGYQNTYVFAERMPVTSNIWAGFDAKVEADFSTAHDG